MNELTNEQVVRLAKVIERWILGDPDLLWEVAVEQAEKWTEEEYLDMFDELPEEDKDDEKV